MGFERRVTELGWDPPSEQQLHASDFNATRNTLAPAIRLRFHNSCFVVFLSVYVCCRTAYTVLQWLEEWKGD